MSADRPGGARRIWILFAQAVAIAAGANLGWRAFAPEPPLSPMIEVRPTPQETPPPARVAPEPTATRSAAEASAGVVGHLESGFREAARRASASVVNVYTRTTRLRRPDARGPLGPQDEDAAQGSSSLGSGVIVSADGFILTNNHVVEDAQEVAVMLPGGAVSPARVVGTDPETDLAVLRVQANGLQPIAFAEPASTQVGDIVLAVGDPFGVGQTVTQGIVSATGRNRLGINTFENFIQTDAAINPGNSGGALVDVSGRLVGINTAIYSRSGGSQGIGFAIPVGMAREVMDQIIATGRVRRGWLGVSARDVIKESTGAPAGAALVAIQPGGPADRAGLRAGDTVLSIDGKKIADTSTLIDRTAAVAPGTKAMFEVQRGRDVLRVPVELGQRPAQRKPS